ncbi:MAG TPA: sulfotransferase domain-containing protein [Gemmatimonadota bacterium]|nr:sulfotransferase domain-containing protein [Gemmatimonadota bacterium]
MLPDFLIVGAMKSGTSTFYHHLIRHPQIAAARTKEVHFFDHRWHKGLNWYRSFFPLKRSMPEGGITGEATPYYLFHPSVPPRISTVLSEVRLLVLLRDPVERTFSHYRHEVRSGRETLSFEDALSAEEERLAGEHQQLVSRPRYRSIAHQAFSYRSRSIYADQVEAWFEWFNPGSMLVVKAEDLFERPDVVTERALRFLGLPMMELGLVPHRNKGRASRMKPETQADLQAFFEPHNQRLYRLLGWDSEW